MFSFAPIVVPTPVASSAPVYAPVAVAAVAPVEVGPSVPSKIEIGAEAEFPGLPKIECAPTTPPPVSDEKISKRKARRDAKLKERAAKENTVVIKELPKKASFVQAATKIPSHPGEIIAAPVPKVKPQQQSVQKPKYVTVLRFPVFV